MDSGRCARRAQARSRGFRGGAAPPVTGDRRSRGGRSGSTAALAADKYTAVETQRLAHGPRLEWAAAWRMRQVAVGDLGKMADARLVEMREQRVEKAAARLGDHLRRSAADADPRLDERAHEPRPDGALVVRGVALADAAFVARRVRRLVGRERAEPERSEQPPLDGIDDSSSPRAFQHREGEA